MNHLKIFSLANLALLSDWLEETGELYVDVYQPHSGASGTGYLIGSLQDLKSLVSQQGSTEIDFTILRRAQFPIRGIADEHLLKQALEHIPDNQNYEIIYPSFYPAALTYAGDGRGHAELRKDLKKVFGELVGVGLVPDVDSHNVESQVSDVFNVNILRKNNLQVSKNQDNYERYNRESERYHWIAELWENGLDAI